MALLGWWLYVSRDNSKEEEKRKWHSVLMNLLNLFVEFYKPLKRGGKET
jgi:hypothetical protein